ncbi:GntR family transcriptional regulator [Pasteurellaceae bacterium LIM206]|nr:GntR family transcriptional regulator [Pasteurellaceae bacterium LIM206]
MINKHSPLPIYAQLEQLIKEQIDTNELKEGDTIPSEREYAEKYKISRMTVRQAITRLTDNGYLQRQRGRGTFVAPKKVEQPLNSLMGFSEEMRIRNISAQTQLLNLQIIEPNSLLEEKLKISADEPVYRIERVRLVENTPISYQIFYTPLSRISGITPEIAKHSLYDYIEHKLGLHLAYAEQEMEVAKAHKKEAEALNVKVGTPVLYIQRISYSEKNDPLEYTISYHLKQYKLKLTIPARSSP